MFNHFCGLSASLWVGGPQPSLTEVHTGGQGHFSVSFINPFPAALWILTEKGCQAMHTPCVAEPRLLRHVVVRQ